MLRSTAVLCLFVLGSCFSSGLRTCPDGRICPEAHQCVEVGSESATDYRCIRNDAIAACKGLGIADGEKCATSDGAGFCQDGACLLNGCGDGQVDSSAGEECDGDLSYFTCLDVGYDRGTFGGCDDLTCQLRDETCGHVGPISFGFLSSQLWKSAGQLFAAGINTTYRFDDGVWTSEFEPVDSAIARIVYDTWVAPNDDVYTVVLRAEGQTFTTEFYLYDGAAWTPLTPCEDLGLSCSFNGSHAIDGRQSTAYVAGFSNLIPRFENGQWTSIATPTATTISIAASTNAIFAILAGSESPLTLRPIVGSVLGPEDTRPLAGRANAWPTSVVSHNETIWLAVSIDDYVNSEAYSFDGNEWILQGRFRDAGRLQIVSTTADLFIFDGKGLWRYRAEDDWVRVGDFENIFGIAELNGTYFASVYQVVELGDWGRSAGPPGQWRVSGQSDDDVWGHDAEQGLVHYDGQNWSAVSDPAYDSDEAVVDVEAQPAGELALLTNTRLHFYDGLWSTNAMDPAEPLSEGAGSPSDFYAISKTGNVLSYDGAQWTQITVGQDPSSCSWTRVATRGSQLAIAGTLGFKICGAIRADGVWTVALLDTEGSPHTLWISPAGTPFLGSNLGAVWRYTNGSWTPEARLPGPVEGISGTSDNDVFAYSGGLFSSLLHFDGVAWSEVRLDGETGLSLFVSPNYIHIGRDSISRWRD